MWLVQYFINYNKRAKTTLFSVEHFLHSSCLCFFVATYCESPTTSHGNVTPSLPSYRAGTIIHLECDLGYKSVSGLNSTCQKSGKWVPSVSNCTAGKKLYVVDTLQEDQRILNIFNVERKSWFSFKRRAKRDKLSILTLRSKCVLDKFLNL